MTDHNGTNHALRKVCTEEAIYAGLWGGLIYGSASAAAVTAGKP
jgi:hypothetical protein